MSGFPFSSPTVFIEQHWPAAKQPEAKPQAKPEPPKVAYKLSSTEEEFSRTLPADQQKQYFEAKQREHEAAQVDSQPEAQGNARVETIRDMGVVLLMSLFGPSTVLFTVLWFTSGQLLNRFDEALEAPDAYEVRPEPTQEELKEGKRGTTPWDNRVERIRSSSDNLEREHLYLGSSIEGDFPVLLHQNLLYRHAHILGDTGSRKTSIGIAPVLTQLIAARIARSSSSTSGETQHSSMPLAKKPPWQGFPLSGSPTSWASRATSSIRSLRATFTG